ncbi:ral guanine nucleotide dissociation stimulator-like 1 [Stegostoma tigrinum]|uniref:ral guanine nucleotide dissociation stimulator-like 1 n=1 Tax=Stegostoma tigrinum TaxID=3053191 RepID=UPI0028700DA8|nr:ral guanine nucleotide dissociation stimulator-like 1 [Stegostoma tigrinum]
MASGDELPSHLTVDTPNVQILNSETSKRLVENFVIALMNKERFYIRTFFSTYKAYTTAESVLYILLDKSKTFDSPNSEKDEEPGSPKETATISNSGNVDSANGEENGSCVSSGSSEIIAEYGSFDTSEAEEIPVIDSVNTNIGNNANILSCEELENPIPPKTVAEIRMSKTFDSPNSEKDEEPSSPKATADISNSGNVDSANGEENGSCVSSGSSEIIADCESVESKHCPNSDEIQNLSSPEKGATVKKSIDFNRSSFLEEYNFSPAEKETLMKIAIPEILEIWLEESAEDFRQVPTYSCLRKVLSYLNQTVPGSDAEERAQKLLSRFLAEEAAEKEMFKGYRRRVRFCVGEEHDQTIEQVDEKLLSYPSRFIAEQLTFMDADLFRKLVPSQCLGSIWSQRGKEEKHHLVSTVQATITQFNNVTKCVTSTILRPQQLKPRQTAKIIEKWIDVFHNMEKFNRMRGVKVHSAPTKSSEQPASLRNEDSDESITSARHLEMEEPSTSQKALEKVRS